MRRSQGIVNVLVGLAAGSFLLAAGCASQRRGPLGTPAEPSAGEPNTAGVVLEAKTPPAQNDLAASEQAQSVTLALKSAPGQTATYIVVTEAEKSVDWHGDASNRPAAFQAGRTGHRTELTFEQQVQRVDEQGNATLKITIKALKYFARVRDTVTFDFDSTRQADQDSVFAGLIGLSYELEMSPKGEVLAVTDVEPARRALQGDSPEQLTALRLLDEPVIKLHHEVPVLMALPDVQVSPGQRWSDIKSLDFGMLGTREFERIHTLKDIELGEGALIAIVEMNAIPSSTLALEQQGQQPLNVFAEMFDSTGSFGGRLQLNLSTGQIVSYVEDLRMQWVAVDPAAAETDTANPAALKMGATQLHRLERVE
ncbi:MAG: hypothetical protein JW993_17760 [Sedimentisphaerales bacterium]|nr:hypothetical protein [Sedimentisphaerales bacterium]